MTTTAPDTTTDSPTPKKTRRRRRSAKIKMPERVPIGVRGLWDSASPQEKERAHAMSTAILEMWLGQTSSAEVSKRLGIPPVRLWQLSQQAVAGMVAGLLKQPKGRPRKADLESLKPGENVTQLKAKVTRLQKQVGHLETLVELLRQLPGQKGVPDVVSAREKTRTGKATSSKGSNSRRKKASG